MWPESGPKVAWIWNILAQNKPVEIFSSPSPTCAKTTSPRPNPHHEKSGPTQPKFLEYFNKLQDFKIYNVIIVDLLWALSTMYIVHTAGKGRAGFLRNSPCVIPKAYKNKQSPAQSQ